MPLVAGDKLGPYEIVAPLGAGGMGEVYRARDIRLDRIVAIKILPGHLGDNAHSRERFEREAHALASINHPDICAIYDVGHQDGIEYLVMEYVEGETLTVRLRRSSIPVEQVLQYAIEIADALDQAHRKGITHRDLKPGNIMLTSAGRAKVLDFGLANRACLVESGSEVDQVSTVAFITLPGTPLGTLGYMSPEQALGKQVDTRTDLFSFGITLYEMATGKRPFQGKTATAICDAILHERPVPPRQLNGEIAEKLQETILKCLEKDPKLRYQTAAEIGADLRRLQRDGDSSRSASINRRLPPGSVAKLGRRAVIGALAVVLVLAIAFRVRRFSAGRTPEIHSLAVLPLKNLSGDPNQEYFADGTTLDLITTLTKIGNLRVISWASVRGYKNTTKSLLKIARELNADGVIDGSVERDGDHVKITIQLVQAEGDRNVWARSYDRELRDILRLQEEVAGTIAQEIRLALTPQDRARLSGNRSVDPEAYLLYSQGRSLMQHWTPDTWRAARGSFHRAIEKDPNYAAAYAGLAETYITGDNLDPKISFPLARIAAAKAIALDDTVSDAHVATALVKYQGDWDWKGGEADFKRAIELNPGDTLAHHLYSHLLLALGRYPQSLEESELYVRLDPVSPAAYDHLGFHYLAAGRYAQAIEAYRKTQLVDPTWQSSHQSLGDAYRHQGMSQEAIAEYELAMAADKTDPKVVMALRQAFELEGWKGYWRKQLNKLSEKPAHEYVSPYRIAVHYALIDDKENAFRYLEKAYANHDDSLTFIKSDHDVDSLHADPGYTALLRKMGLPAEEAN
jgi:serine/threonine protein kinase/tetratricopeptide (TPR) repeat protein